MDHEQPQQNGLTPYHLSLASEAFRLREALLELVSTLLCPFP